MVSGSVTRDTGIHDDILKIQVIATADTGFFREENNDYFAKKISTTTFQRENPDPGTRIFLSIKKKYEKRNQYNARNQKKIIPTGEPQNAIQ